MSVPEKTVVTAQPATVRPRRTRFASRALIAALVVAALIAIVVVVATGALGGGGSSPGSADNAVATGVARIAERSLSSQTQVSATLGYADPTTIVVPAGTAPSNLQQAQQTVATDEGMLQSAQATLASDTETLAQLRAALAAARAKEAVDCQGTNAAASPAAAGSAGGGSGSTPCASDEQTVTTDEQSETQAAAKVVADQSQVSSAGRGLAAAQSALTADESSGSVYGQSSAYTALPPVGKIVTRARASTRSAASRSYSSTVRSPRGGRSCPECQRVATSAS